jgi:hypothetical protein
MVMQKKIVDGKKPVGFAPSQEFDLTGMSWGDSFVYDISSKLATMHGAVEIRHTLNDNSEAVLQADTVKADFAAPVVATRPAAPASTGDLADASLKKLYADGSVVVHMQGRIIQGDHLVYDPQTQRMAFSADADRFCDVVNETTQKHEGQFSSLIWNLQNNTLEEVKNPNARGR